jgi:predicted ATPase/DNA-binding SARP family transcriptional activator
MCAARHDAETLMLGGGRAMARLRLSLLGALQLTLDGQPVSGFAYNKARALLAYLAVEADRPHHRDTLVGLLWPELPATAARTNLRQALANLREAIGDAGATPPFLLITRDSIQFNPDSDYELDLDAFVALLAACENHTHRHLERCRSCAARMEQAITLYRGDFLAGFSVGDSAPFEEWQLRQRERLHRQALDTLAHLADYYEQRGDSEAARHHAQRQVELEPWREEAHRQLMRLLARGHQRTAALAQYETCRRILARDLGVEPEAETTALYERIRDTTNAELSTRRDASQHMQNFPAQTTRLIGRETELSELGALLENPACRLITIVGPGGIGKTRLALAAAAEQADVFRHGAAFVPLAAISLAELLVPTILSALSVGLQGQEEPRDQLLDYLRGKELLLVLDNVEQLLAPHQDEHAGFADLLVAILVHAPGITLLVTSRERLGLAGEWLFDISGLSYPLGESVEAIESYTAVQLFVQRATQVRRQFALVEGEAPAVARICRKVEGLPLAIELAAAALRTRTCEAIADAIERNLSTLTTGLRAVPERQRSMAATFEHSWYLLSDAEQQVFAQLSAFRGGFDEDAAAQVAQATPELLAALLDKSLLRWDGAARYDMHELVRQYAREKLEQVGEADRTYARHATYYLALAEMAAAALHGSQQATWLERLEQEPDNLNAALDWFGEREYAEQSWRLAAALYPFWEMRGYQAEAHTRFTKLLTRAEADGTAGARTAAWANLLTSAGLLAVDRGEIAKARSLFVESLAIYRERGDTHGSAEAVFGLAQVDVLKGDYPQAASRFEESLALFRAAGDRRGCALALKGIGRMARDQGDFQRADRCFAEGLALLEQVGDRRGRTTLLIAIAEAARLQADYARAAALYDKCLAEFRALGDTFLIALVLLNAGYVHLNQGDPARADGYFLESLTLWRELGLPPWAIVGCLVGLGGVAAARQQPERAAHLFGAAIQDNTLSSVMEPADQADTECCIAAARAQLDEAIFAAAWAEGQVMTSEQAIAYALQGSEVTSASSITRAALQ